MSARSRQVWLLSRYDTFIIPALFLFVLGNTVAWGMPAFPMFGWMGIVPVLLVVGLLLGLSSRRWILRTCLWVVAFLLGGVYFNQFAFQPGALDPVHLAPFPRATVEGVVVRTQKDGHKGQLRVLTVNGRYAEGRIQLTRTPEPLPSVGTTVLVHGDLVIPGSQAFPGAFDYQKYLATQKISTLMKGVTNVEVVHDDPITLADQVNAHVADIRKHMVSVFGAKLTSPGSDVLSGIVLGSHAIPIDRDTKTGFIQTGLIHFLAASGLNVGIIAGFLLWICGLCRLKGRRRLFIAMAGVAVYILLAGASPSVLRAGTMLELALFFKLLDKNLSLVYLLALAIAVLVAFDPNVVGSLGFQFSVLTTFGLITMVPPLQDWLGQYLTRWVSGLILVPLIAQLWVLPLSVYHFNQLPLHSVPLNILAVALVTPLTVIGFVTGLLGLVWAPLGEWVSLLAWPFVEGLLLIVNWGRDMHWAQLTPASPPAWLVPTAYAALLGVLYMMGKEQRSAWKPKAVTACVLTMTLLCTSALALNIWEQRSATVIDVLPLSRVHAAVLIQPRGSASVTLLLPCRPGYWEGRVLGDYLKHRGVSHISAVVVWGDASESTTAQRPLASLIPYAQLTSETPLISLQNLREGQELVFGEIRINKASRETGAGQRRWFRITHPAFCMLGTERASDTFECPLTLVGSATRGVRLWSTLATQALDAANLRHVTVTDTRIRVY